MGPHWFITNTIIQLQNKSLLYVVRNRPKPLSPCSADDDTHLLSHVTHLPSTTLSASSPFYPQPNYYSSSIKYKQAYNLIVNIFHLDILVFLIFFELLYFK